MAIASRQLRLAMLCVCAGIGILWLRFWVGYTPYVSPTPASTSAPTFAPLHPRGWITAADYGERWPFTVDAGQLQCFPGKKVVFIADETSCAVNGVAKSDGRWKASDSIWRHPRVIPKGGLAISDIIAKGLQMC